MLGLGARDPRVESWPSTVSQPLVALEGQGALPVPKEVWDWLGSQHYCIHSSNTGASRAGTLLPCTPRHGRGLVRGGDLVRCSRQAEA